MLTTRACIQGGPVTTRLHGLVVLNSLFVKLVRIRLRKSLSRRPRMIPGRLCDKCLCVLVSVLGLALKLNMLIG